MITIFMITVMYLNLISCGNHAIHNIICKRPVVIRIWPEKIFNNKNPFGRIDGKYIENVNDNATQIIMSNGLIIDDNNRTIGYYLSRANDPEPRNNAYLEILISTVNQKDQSFTLSVDSDIQYKIDIVGNTNKYFVNDEKGNIISSDTIIYGGHNEMSVSTQSSSQGRKKGGKGRKETMKAGSPGERLDAGS